MTEFENKVLHALLLIPKGRVTTYRNIAIYLGDKNLVRAVGNALHKNKEPLKYPCYKVVNSKGQLATHYAFGGINKQTDLLNKDGIEVINKKINLKKYLFEF